VSDARQFCLYVLSQYMDRTYVTQQHKTPVFQLGLDLWRDQVSALLSSARQYEAVRGSTSTPWLSAQQHSGGSSYG